MKVAITISGDAIDAPPDARFGRAPAFCVIDTGTDEWVTKGNPAISSTGGAGVQAAQFVTTLGVQAVVSGAFGPNAFDALRAAGIAMYSAPTNRAATAREVLAMFQKGELTTITEATKAGRRNIGRR